MKIKLNLILIIIMTLLMAACSNEPKKSEVETQVRAALLADGGDLIYDVVNVKKTSGKNVNDNSYVAEVEYQIKFKIGLQEIGHQMYEEAKGYDDLLGISVVMGVLEEEYGAFESGEILKESKGFKFIKNDKKWYISSM